MINNDENPVAWALMLMELDEAKEHLEKLTNQMAVDNLIDEEDFKIQLFHVMTHLNRIWNGRNQDEEESHQNFSISSNTPTEFVPVG
ncbi:MAG: hypothetical protein V4660_20730 [Pseudomonadota bacterium]